MPLAGEFMHRLVWKQTCETFRTFLAGRARTNLHFDDALDRKRFRGLLLVRGNGDLGWRARFGGFFFGVAGLHRETVRETGDPDFFQDQGVTVLLKRHFRFLVGRRHAYGIRRKKRTDRLCVVGNFPLKLVVGVLPDRIGSRRQFRVSGDKGAAHLELDRIGCLGPNVEYQGKSHHQRYCDQPKGQFLHLPSFGKQHHARNSSFP